ncbi:DUF2850 domain-containing protein [Vibrio panuliri]|uniref:DUF2850 domain-containing protein n=1 Tax=Vibrio panuliri TaxID=1381081 RepID=UPI0009F95DD9|nr:DUF2850 domain-containing protein [Vibrio panuliri]KAB1455162.1 DUF2850 domain-containing protein [Vibrio panuliri]
MNVRVKNKPDQGKKTLSFPYQFSWLRGLMWLSAMVALYALLQGMMLLNVKYQQATHPESLIYGSWVEQDVAPYRADRIVISQHGVAIDGRVVATDFQFDGEFLTFHQGSEERHFKFQNENWNEMTLQTDKSYQPVFVKI